MAALEQDASVVIALASRYVQTKLGSPEGPWSLEGSHAVCRCQDAFRRF